VFLLKLIINDVMCMPSDFTKQVKDLIGNVFPVDYFIFFFFQKILEKIGVRLDITFCLFNLQEIRKLRKHIRVELSD
jgi:hypothetical protein